MYMKFILYCRLGMIELFAENDGQKSNPYHSIKRNEIFVIYTTFKACNNLNVF